MKEERKPRVIVAHPSKQHSFYTATAFEREGMLEAYITTIYDKDGSITHGLKRLLKGKDLKKATTRSCSEIPDEKVVQFYELDYLVSLFINRIPRLRRFREKHRRYVANKFGKKVAKYAMEHDVDAVIMYDSTAETCFEILKETCPDILRILDCSISCRPFMKNNFEKDMSLYQHAELMKEHPDFWVGKDLKSSIREIKVSDAYFAPSNIVKKSIDFCGGNVTKVEIVPYGVDVQKFQCKEKPNDDNKLRLIYVGQVTYRKGIHHLLNVVSRFSKDQIEVDLVGTYDAKSNLYLKYCDLSNIHFCGFITRDVLASKYKMADMFVFPTLGEGYGLVVLESLACGVPVICSNLAGGDDAIRDGVNGYIFSPFDEEELFEKIQYCISNIKNIREMSGVARNTALNYTWDRYYVNIISAFRRIWSEKCEKK